MSRSWYIFNSSTDKKYDGNRTAVQLLFKTAPALRAITQISFLPGSAIVSESASTVTTLIIGWERYHDLLGFLPFCYEAIKVRL